MKKALKVFRIIVIVPLSLVLLVNLWLLFSRVALKNELPKFFGFSTATVLSGSMEPTFSAGDILVFREADSYSVGDIVIFSQGDALVTHRIVDETSDGFVTRGDANNSNDIQALDEENIEGVMLCAVPFIGQVFTFLRTPLGILVLVIIGFLLIELPSITELIKTKKVKHE